MKLGALRSGDPDRLGPYVLLGRVGEGGQGAVFLGAPADPDDAEPAADAPRYAVKLLHADLTADDKARARFLRELDVAKRVASFCTAQVIDADVDGDRPYIVSEYVPGPSLNQLVQDEGPLSGAALERLAVGTATALAAIHQGRIVHRDLKPHNVLIGPDGPRVIDFGVARAISGTTTLTSRVIGTPSYMAPEQIKGEEIGTAADVFCWAATLTYAATGEPPFGQDSIHAVINRVLHEEPDLHGLTGPLRDLLAECLDKEPARRPSAAQVLMRTLGTGDVPAVPDYADDDVAMLAAGSAHAAEWTDPGYTDVMDGPGVTGDLLPLAGVAATSTAPSAGTGGTAARRRPALLPAALSRSGQRMGAVAAAGALVLAVGVTFVIMALTGPEKSASSTRVTDPGTSESPSSTYEPRPRRSGVAPEATAPQAPPGYGPTPSDSPAPSDSPTAPQETSAPPKPPATPTARPTTPGPTAPTTPPAEPTPPGNTEPPPDPGPGPGEPGSGTGNTGA
ncbi:serine/threonine-protein kinase [Actinomadura flavalba]|uniref:serine/threonine-protein kinase n=1 Tax=Actinomadura flavalba TaxID=1120938 RepID=UPI00037EDB4C|nr:serine/threonine-protein kinase [Actinomadura flavalba]